MCVCVCVISRKRKKCVFWNFGEKKRKIRILERWPIAGRTVRCVTDNADRRPAGIAVMLQPTSTAAEAVSSGVTSAAQSLRIDQFIEA